MAAGKLKKGAAEPVVRLVENPDILASLAQGARRPKLVIGFAAETSDVAVNAAAKIARKGCDWLVANEVGAGKVFGADENEVMVLRRDGACEKWARAGKVDVARRLVGEIVKFLK